MGQRIVLHKHYDEASQITVDKFFNDIIGKGEIVISNEYGKEGIYIINTEGMVVKIGGGGSGSGSTPSGEYITPQDLKDYLNRHAYTTSGNVVNITTTEIVNYLNEHAYVTSGTVNEITTTKIVNYLNEHAYTTSANVVDITAMEIAKIIDSADSRYDTLKEIADWIISDTTGAAKMANDIAELQEEIKHVSSGDHVFLSRREYDELIRNGVADVSGETIEYSDDVYYCIYEGGGEPTPTGDTVVYILSGDTIIFPTLTESGGMIEINAEVINGFINLDNAYVPSGGGDEDVVIEDDNIVVNPSDVQTINGEDFVDLSNYNIQPIE